MKTLKGGYSLLVILLVSMVSVGSVNPQDDSLYGYRYAYFRPAFEESHIGFIDPTNSSTLETIKVPRTEGWTPVGEDAVFSPDGTWFSFYASSLNSSAQALQLFNLRTGEIRTITTASTRYNRSRNIAWSPDGEKVTFLIREGSDVEIYVYHLADHKIVNISQDSYTQVDFAWVTNDQLVYFTRLCYGGEPCSGQLQLVQVSTREIIRTITLPLIFVLLTSVCDLTPSPNGLYVAFIFGCSGYPEVTIEAYLWDITANTFLQVTDLFVRRQYGYTIIGYFHLAWLDDQSLLVGSRHQDFQEPQRDQLSIYRVDSRRLSPIAFAVADQFAVNPLTGTVAIGNIEQARDNLPFGITKFDAHSCGLWWSPDGRFVISPVYSQTECQRVVSAINFLDTLDNSLTVYTVPEEIEYFYPVGWVVR
jgi:WD40 repeat protein